MTASPIRGPGLAVLLAIVAATPLVAQIRGREDRPDVRRQRRVPSLSLTAGPSSYDLVGTGTGFAAALRFDIPSGRRFIVEPGFAYFRYHPSPGNTIAYVLPELSFQFEASRSAVRPFVGLGAGLAEFATGPAGSRGTVHAVAGIRSTFGGRIGLRAEGRLRSYDPLGASGRMLDFGFGGLWLLRN